MQHIHEYYLNIAINNAKSAQGKVSPNPMVGAVLVYNNEIIGQGIHQQFGGAHAEVNTINSVATENKDKIKDSTLYVSLEPCNHYGKTGPCTELIIQHGIKSLVFSNYDPNPLMSGKSIQLLKDQGVKVVGPLCEEQGKTLLQSFTVNQLQKRPYIILKFAESSDFFISQLNQRTKISHAHTDLFVHKWRNEVDAILVGSETVIIDNPALTTRYGMGKSPRRIVLDRRQRIDKNRYTVFKDDNYIDVDPDIQNDLKNLMHFLYAEKNIGILLVEGGKKILESFIKQFLVDEIRLIRSRTLKLNEGIRSPQFCGIKRQEINLVQDIIYVLTNITV